jgi:glycosyltransferase involved in cell wall biosynthesis
MKIVCIATSRIPSDTANSIQVMKACHALGELGHQVSLLVPAHELGPGKNLVAWSQLASYYGLGGPPMERRTWQDGFQIEWLAARPGWKRYDFSMAAVQRARALKADIVYVWPLQAAVFALLRGMPVLLELHGEPEGKLGPSVFGMYLRLPGKKRLLPITQALADHLERMYRRTFLSGESVVSPNGVDLERYEGLPSPSEARLLLNLPDCLTVGYSGHLYPGRGMGLLVELARRYDQIQFLWVGGRPADVADWQNRLKSENVKNVTLTGFVENSRLPLYQAAMDILLMPYERMIEGSSGGNSADFCSPMKMFEYMACGRAIVSSDLPVIREVLDETLALLCPPQDAASWVEALGSLIRDPERRESLGSNARQAVLGYTWRSRARKALEGFAR